MVINRGRIVRHLILIVVVMLTFAFLFTDVGQASEERFNMSYLYFGGPETHIRLVNQTNGALDVISPSYFDLNPDGSLKITTKFSTKFIDEMHNQDIKVVPFLSNHWDRQLGRNALANSEALAIEIATVIEDFDLDGVNIDLENLTDVDREAYSNFIKILREKIPQSKEVSVAVAANPKSLSVGWHGSYDYEELAKYADYLMIMAYDESYFGSKPGPIASIGFVEKSIQYALERVSPDKIVLGIPFYGRYWNHNEEKGGRGIHLTNLDSLINAFDAKTLFLKTHQSPVSVFEIKEDDEDYYVYGRKLSTGVYSAWYENEESIKAKLELVNKYNLKGSGSWSLGQELPSTWSYYLEALNATSPDSGNNDENVGFPDIDAHWAKEDILAVKTKGWMTGYDNGLFDPDSSLTRAQAAVTIVRALKLEKSEIDASSFKDVSNNHWAKNEIEAAKLHGVIKGIDGNNFDPDRPVTREEMAVMLNRALGFDNDVVEPEESLFEDVKKDSWSYVGISTMASKGLIRGYDDGSFGPFDDITRAQMATMLNRMTEYIDYPDVAINR